MAHGNPIRLDRSSSERSRVDRAWSAASAVLIGTMRLSSDDVLALRIAVAIVTDPLRRLARRRGRPMAGASRA